MSFVRFLASIYSEKEKNQRINSSYMRHAAFFSLLCLLFLPGFSQEVQEGYKKINQFIVPVDLLDPAYPVMKSTGDEVRDAETFRIELRIYTKTIGKFPKYISTGDQAKDEAAYDEACKLYLAQHPYFPQPINTNNPRGAYAST